VDDGATWRSVPLVPSNITLPVTIAGKSMIMPGYRFTLANLSDVYVSLRVNATYTVDEIRQSQTTIRAFYVRPLVVITVGPLGSGADYTSISEALQVASPYSKIMVFPGIYLEGTLTIDKPLNITSTAGMNVTVVKGGTFNVRANNVVISGFTISEGSIGVSAFSVGNLILRSCNITSNTVGLLIIDSSVKIVGTEISENAREGVAAYGSNVELESSSIYNNGLPPSVAPAILLVGSSRACLDKSTIRDNTWGILQYDSSSSLLRRCDISNNNVGIVLLKSSCADVTYSCLHSNLWAIIAYSNSSLTVDSSTIYGNTYEGVVGYDASKVFLCSSSISNNGFNGMSMYDVSTLYLANSSVSGNIAGLILLDNSTACISISRVCNNTWGALAYNSSKLEAEDSAICANAFEGVVGFDSALIKSSGSLVADNTHNGVLMFGNSRLEAIDSRIQGSGAAGVYLCESSSALMKSSYSCNNTWGILGYEGTSLQIKGSHISYNVHEGIVLRGWSTLNMTGSTLTDNERGMVIYDLSMVTAGNSTMASNTYEGIVLYSNSSLQASYLNVSRNIRGISAYDMATVSAHHVIIALNTYEGIYIGGNATVALSNSSLTFNAWGMVVGIGSHATAHVHNSSIANNAEYGVLNWGMVPVNATYNWWGDPSGPYHPILNPSGAGDKVSDLVLFEPWLTSPPELWGISISGSIEYAGLTYGAGIVAKVHSGSLTGMDLLDAEAPPAPPEGLDMFFSIGDVKCLEDARPPATTIAWRFTVRTVNVKLVIP
jgi:parallel beta-helix repeat protein